MKKIVINENTLRNIIKKCIKEAFINEGAPERAALMAIKHGAGVDSPPNKNIWDSNSSMSNQLHKERESLKTSNTNWLSDKQKENIKKNALSSKSKKAEQLNIDKLGETEVKPIIKSLMNKFGVLKKGFDNGVKLSNDVYFFRSGVKEYSIAIYNPNVKANTYFPYERYSMHINSDKGQWTLVDTLEQANNFINKIKSIL